MMRWSCQRLHGCVPVRRARRRAVARARAAARGARPSRGGLGERLAAAGAHLDLGRDQLADEVLARAACPARPPGAPRSGSSSSSVSGSRIANSSSTASVKSRAVLELPRGAERICSSGLSAARRPSRAAYCEGCEQPLGDARPAPALDDRAARGRAPSARALVGREREQRASLAARSAASPVAKLASVAQLGRVLLLEPLGDLGEARVARDERRPAGGGGLGRDHPERLGEDRRHDGDVGERQQVDEVAVLERAGEERPRRRDAPRARAR